MNKDVFFTVIIPTLNRSNLLKVAVDSILAQDFENFELIIIDDGSTDNTKDLINSFKSPKIKYIYQQNKGPAAARNTGIKFARGNFICFLDSDDRWRKEKLSKTYQYIKEYPEFKVFHTEELWYKNNSYLEQKKKHTKPQGRVFEQALKLCCISISTVTIDKIVFEKIGLFDENFLACEDYEFWLRTCLFFEIKLIPEYLTIKEGGRTDQQSRKVKNLDKYRFYAIKKLILEQNLNKNDLDLALINLEEKADIYLQGLLKRNPEQAANFKLEKENLLKQFSHGNK